jgi:hypothetical protein
MAATLLLSIVSCKPTFDAAQVLQSDENRKELYKNIVSDPVKFSEFLEIVNNDKNARSCRKFYFSSYFNQIEASGVHSARF